MRPFGFGAVRCGASQHGTTHCNKVYLPAEHATLVTQTRNPCWLELFAERTRQHSAARCNRHTPAMEQLQLSTVASPGLTADEINTVLANTNAYR